MTLAAALERIAHLEAEIAQRDERWAMAEGRRASGVRRIEGFTETQTGILRILHARGRAEHANYECLYRHMSNIRKKLREMNLGIGFRTLVGEGYELTHGKDILGALLKGEMSPGEMRRAA